MNKNHLLIGLVIGLFVVSHSGTPSPTTTGPQTNFENFGAAVVVGFAGLLFFL